MLNVEVSIFGQIDSEIKVIETTDNLLKRKIYN